MVFQDAKQLPTKTFLEKTTEANNQLSIQFPVSSGQQHRKSGKKFILNDIFVSKQSTVK